MTDQPSQIGMVGSAMRDFFHDQKFIQFHAFDGFESARPASNTNAFHVTPGPTRHA
jgi:hypothetical protein